MTSVRCCIIEVSMFQMSGRCPGAVSSRLAAKLSELDDPVPYRLSGDMLAQRIPQKGRVRANGTTP